MNLIVFPGGGSPKNPRYAKVYSAIDAEARRAGYSEVDLTVAYPSHFDSDPSNASGMRFDTAVDRGLAAVRRHEESNATFDLLARSFGCLIAAKIARDMRPRGLRRLVIWGPPPFWRLWEMLVKDIDAISAEGRQKGVLLDRETFGTLTPFEHLLPGIACEVVIATGTKDQVCSPAHVRYLEALHGREARFSFRVVEGAPHEVSPDNVTPDVLAAYSDALFR